MTDLRVLTFNIRGAYHRNDGVNAWPERAALNVRIMRQYAPDLIGFQELQVGNLDVYREELPAYHAFLGPRAEFHEPHQFNAIFWNPARLEPRASGGFWLSTTPERFSADWDTNCLRAAAWVRFRCRVSGAEFLHLNTHLDHISALARREGSALILRQLAALAAPDLAAIVTADFNCNPAQPPYRLFQEGGFADTFLVAGQAERPEAATFHGFAGADYALPERENSGRIDWILTRDGAWRIHTSACAIIRDAEPPRFPSDHYPVLARLAFSPAAP